MYIGLKWCIFILASILTTYSIHTAHVTILVMFYSVNLTVSRGLMYKAHVKK